MRKLHVAVAAVALAIGAGVWMYERADASTLPAFRFGTVERGNVQSTVSATGSLSAVTTVQVGTQVSGQVSAIYVDFNSKVKKGQLLARIDPTLAEQAVEAAAAALQGAEAQLTQAQQAYTSEKQLYDARAVTATEFNAAQANYTVAQSNAKSASIALDKAKQNLTYTSITAPIDGVVVERNVDVGQTVAASLSAPQLFLIANDLSRMQILASVDESDIGLIKDGQPVTFTVQSYPNRTFTGTVSQVRLQSTTQDNVVSYTVVVSVGNPGGVLLPGMTATVQFLTASATNVLVVPNAALRVRPTAAMMTSGAAQRTAGSARGAASGSSTRPASAAAGATVPDSTRTHARSAVGAGTGSAMGTLWTVGKDGKATPMRVRTGLSDGQRTEVQGAGLAQGMQIVVGVAQPTASAAPAAGTTNPLQAQSRGGRGTPRPGGF